MALCLADWTDDLLAKLCEYLEAHLIIGMLRMTGNSLLWTKLKRSNIRHWTITERMSSYRVILEWSKQFPCVRSIRIKWDFI